MGTNIWSQLTWRGVVAERFDQNEAVLELGVVIFERKSSDAHSIKREMSLMGKTKTTNQQDV